jgi:hypothetical protein
LLRVWSAFLLPAMTPEVATLYESALWSENPRAAFRALVEHRLALGSTQREVRAELAELYASLRHHRREEDEDTLLRAIDALAGWGIRPN